MNEEVLLDIEDLSIDLNLETGRIPVVRDVSFRLRAGQILGVVGESGSGKSMTVLSIARMLPKAADVAGGAIHYEGRDLLGMSDAEVTGLRGDRLGMVFQDPMAFLNPLMTVGQQIREVLILHGMPKDVAAPRAIELLEIVGVRDPHQRIHDYPHQFSGGMRQRVIIAIAIANNPNLLLADEPTSALDVTVQAGILRLLQRLRDELGMGLVLITHDIGIVEEICDQALVMYAGRVVERGGVDEVLANPKHPYTRELMRSTPRLDLPARRRLAAIPGRPPDVQSRPDGCSFHPRCPLVLDRCHTDDPPLTERLPGHAAACWLPSLTAPTTTDADSPPAAQTPTADMRPILEMTEASVSYDRLSRWRHTSQRPAVNEVNLRAYAGRALGLVGESGCGKSTLARAIVGLVPLSSGTVQVDGHEWATSSREERAHLRRTVQLVFQDPYLSLNPRQRILDILTEPLIVHDLVPRAGRRARVEELISHVGLPKSVLDRYPYQLSGGQRQRVGIARALAMEPKLIVADEPVSALDVSVQAQIINLLADLRDELGLGYVVISHDLSVVRHLCEDVAVMQNGRIVEHAPTSTIFATPQHPYTVSLLAASPGSPWANDDVEVAATTGGDDQ